MTYPTYIQASYEWLLKNLHNPYPSKELKTQIARDSRSLLKDVDAWFVDARRRIGWNAFRKARFSNKRTEIIDAATRFFVKNDLKRPLDPTVELEFVAVECRAKDLYSGKFFESSLATTLDLAVRNLTPAIKAQSKLEEKQRKLERRRRDKMARAALSYPSPQHSPGASPEPSLPSPTPDTVNLQAIIATSPNRKRRHISSRPLEDNSEEDRPRKRSRCAFILIFIPFTFSHSCTESSRSLPLLFTLLVFHPPQPLYQTFPVTLTSIFY